MLILNSLKSQKSASSQKPLNYMIKSNGFNQHFKQLLKYEYDLFE